MATIIVSIATTMTSSWKKIKFHGA